MSVSRRSVPIQHHTGDDIARWVGHRRLVSAIEPVLGGREERRSGHDRDRQIIAKPERA